MKTDGALGYDVVLALPSWSGALAEIGDEVAILHNVTIGRKGTDVEGG